MRKPYDQRFLGNSHSTFIDVFAAAAGIAVIDQGIPHPLGTKGLAAPGPFPS
jgi:hypothetical protein